MDSIAADDLFDERGEVSWHRPILQGDVFRDVVLPGFGDGAHYVQILTHPCSMRQGLALNERIQVAPVVEYQKVKNWNEHGKVMPMPDLFEDGVHWATRFVDATAAPSSALGMGNRIATLSQPGIFILQQRYVRHTTRVILPLDKFREQSAPVLTEAEIQETWARVVLDGAEPTAESIAAAQESFEAWLDENDKERRKALASELNHAGLRRAVKASAEAHRQG